MAYQNRVSSWCEYWKQKITSKIFSRPGGPPLKCGIIYKELTEFVLTRYLTNILIHSLTYAMHVDINPPACCCGVVYVVWWWWECWDDRDVWKDVGIFQKVASDDRISACDAIDLDMMHINPIHLYLLSPYMFGVRQPFWFFLLFFI